MPDPRKPIPVSKVPCHVCRKEVPRSSARTAEGRDYIYHFCGASCHQQWTDERRRPASRGPS